MHSLEQHSALVWVRHAFSPGAFILIAIRVRGRGQAFITFMQKLT